MSLGKMKVLSVAALIAVSGAVQAAVSQPLHVTIEYEYAKDGEIVSRKINGAVQRYEYDLRGQLTGVYDGNGKAVEAYQYDAAGNILKKTLNSTTTTFKYDAANQLVSKKDEAGTTSYEYDAAGRMIREGEKEYRYSYLDKITSVIENGATAATMDYFVGGQLASVTRGNDAERFIWDGLALVHRDGSDYLNEPAIGGGNPVASDGKVMFNDRLGSTVAVKGDESYSLTSMTAFGESSDSGAFFTGKPFIGELGYAFLMRSYRPENGKWQTADPMGYPDGWNNLAYCNNGVTSCVDLFGAEVIFATPKSDNFKGFNEYYNRSVVLEDGELERTTSDGYTKYQVTFNANFTGSGWANKAVATPYIEQNGFTVSYGHMETDDNGETTWIENTVVKPVAYTPTVKQVMPVVYNEWIRDDHDGYLTYFLKATLTLQEGIEGQGYSAASDSFPVELLVSKRVKKE